MRIRTLDEAEVSDALVEKILDAPERSGGPRPSAAWFRRKFLASPVGRALTALAEEDGEVAGVVAFGRLGLRIDGEPIAGGLSYETFVAPAFRGRGLFLELLEHATDAARDAGVRLLFNFPNAASLPGFLKRGWQPGAGFQNWLRVRRPLALWSARRNDPEGTYRPAPPQGDAIASVDLSPFVASLRQDGAPAATIEPDYREDFLRWRFAPEWQIDYAAVGADALPMIVRTGTRWGSREVQILEIASDRAPSRARLRATLREIGERWDPALVSCSLSLAHPLTRRLALGGFVPVPTRSNFCHLPLDPELAERVRGRKWSLTGTLAHMY